ncbi:MAG TPA: hypothetical protein VJ302_34315 [Blastocatellia bacterium]|nr:hypothetical protein [Blastocatellia bacterium]
MDVMLTGRKVERLVESMMSPRFEESIPRRSIRSRERREREERRIVSRASSVLRLVLLVGGVSGRFEVAMALTLIDDELEGREVG